ncbi:MAG: FIST N-terminal domain-containing protein [Candidatus Didemnitutus sp.]|nr:FIST N-terminal domain-containing protein [Candidatus Didemnitutus sp.]
MKITQTRWSQAGGWSPALSEVASPEADLVFLFGASVIWTKPELLEELHAVLPGAKFLGCSTSGEIHGTEVTDDTLVVTVVKFAHTQLRGAAVRIEGAQESRLAAKNLMAELPRSVPSADGNGEDPLVHVFVLSDGLNVNGSELVHGLTAGLPQGVSVTGGLAGDGARFVQTHVVWEGKVAQKLVAAIGFYGRRLQVGCGSLGGWDSFGPERVITRSQGNVLYEFDGQSALALYKKYLGEHAAGLPATGLLFPLSLRTKSDEMPVVRTILGIDEQAGSMIFAGDVPEGSYARLMKANFDRLIDGASGAATTGYQAIGSNSPELALLISCVGRKLVLKQRIEEEVEGVREVLGAGAALTGFYSYGEISPFTPGAKCELHNQTMTITTLREI